MLETKYVLFSITDFQTLHICISNKLYSCQNLKELSKNSKILLYVVPLKAIIFIADFISIQSINEDKIQETFPNPSTNWTHFIRFDQVHNVFIPLDSFSYISRPNCIPQYLSDKDFDEIMNYNLLSKPFIS